MAAHRIKGGPSDAGMAAASNEPAHGQTWALLAAHQPALGLDRSVCLRDVVNLLRDARTQNFATGRDRAVSGWHAAADELEREFGGGT